MVSRISVRLLVSVELVDFAHEQFAKLMEHPDHREDALQELRMVDAFLFQATDAQKRRTAHSALSWLQYDLGVVTAEPSVERPQYEPLPRLEEGSFLNDLSERLEAARLYDRAA
jgi:hypothetical protein